MTSAVMNIINTSFRGIADNFIRIINASQVSSIYFVALFVFLAVRFILMPLFRSSVGHGSDRARGDVDE